MISILACPPCFIRLEDSRSNNRCNRVQLTLPFGMCRYFFTFETRYFTEIVQAKNFIPRAVDFFSNRPKQGGDHRHPSNCQSGYPLRRLRKKRPPSTRKFANGVQLCFECLVPIGVDEWLRESKIQEKLYGIDCQNVISIRPYFGAHI